jgi:hypothetical protein
MESLASAVVPFMEMKTPRVNFDLPSIFSLKTKRSASGQAFFSHLASIR